MSLTFFNAYTSVLGVCLQGEFFHLLFIPGGSVGKILLEVDITASDQKVLSPSTGLLYIWASVASQTSVSVMDFNAF